MPPFMPLPDEGALPAPQGLSSELLLQVHEGLRVVVFKEGVAVAALVSLEDLGALRELDHGVAELDAEEPGKDKLPSGQHSRHRH